MSVCLVECKMKGECVGGDVSRHVGVYLFVYYYSIVVAYNATMLSCVVFSVVDDDAFDILLFFGGDYQ